MKFAARFILVSLLFTICYLLFTIPASAQLQNPLANQAQAPAQANPYTVPNTNPDVPKNLHTWTQNVMIEVMSAMACQLTGIDPTNPKKSQCLGVDTKTGKIGFVENGGGAIGVVEHMIAMLYTPPLHTGDYFKDLARNFGIVKPAYAAGFEGLSPLKELWRAFRNIVYLLFVIVFIVIGLAIMFRVRIDPRTVMTIQNQIPRIIIGLLLVTFSFAIAGFLIDLMYVVIYLAYSVISQAAPAVDLTGLNPLNLVGKTAVGAAGNIGGVGGVFEIAHKGANAIKDMIDSFLDLGNYFSAASITIHVISGVIALITAAVGPGILLGILNFVLTEVALREALPFLIAYLIIIIALFFALIRLWFALIMAYIFILIDVVFAPFWIVAGLLPGSPIGFGAWLRSITANLAAFPATIIMFLLGRVFFEAFQAAPKDQFVPPLIGSPPGTKTIGALIGIGIILMTPNVVNMVKAAMKAPTLTTTGILAGLAGGTRVVTGTVGGGITARMASQEYIPDPNAVGGFKRRGARAAIFGRIFGR